MADKILKSLNFGGADNYFPLPIVSTNDNNKILSVVNGEWVVKEAPSGDGTGQYVWSKKDSADGPVTGYVISNDGEKYPDGGWKDGVFYTLELDQRILIGIQVTTAPTTVEYTEGDSLDLTGLVVTATFNDGSTEDVTSQCIFSPASGTVLATTDTSVNISYTYKGVTRSTAQIIVVEAAVTPYLSFLGNEDFTLKTANTTKNWDGTLEYSTDTSTWNAWDGTEISSTNSKLYLRGTGNTKITGNSSNYRFVFTGTSALKIACEGNIESLLDCVTVRDGGHPAMANYCYRYMFQGCTSLTTAPALPATTLVTMCYNRMFQGCTALTTAPALPATTLAEDCYSYMFHNCTSLTTAPALPATTLAAYCYQCMFQYCASLTTAPTLPATTLATYCYQYMFSNCTSLTTIPKLPATTLATYCYQYMFQSCTSITTAPALPATTLADHCYNGMFWDCTSLTTAPSLPATTLTNYCYYYMFSNCTSLTTIPKLPATTLATYCYMGMFKTCSNIQLSKSRLGSYPTAYRIPTSGTGTTATDALKDMFADTGGTFTGTPSINTTYYTSNTVV